MIKAFCAVALAVLLLLQYRYWFGTSGTVAIDGLRQTIAATEARARRLDERNSLLKAEVLALREGDAAVEARARSELGMIKSGETFYVVDGP